MGVLGRDFRIGIGHGKNNRVRRHAFHHIGGERALGRQAKENIRTLHRLRQSAQMRIHRMGGFPLVHALRTAAIDHALGVAENDIFRRKTNGLDQIKAGKAGRARAIAHQPCLLDVASGQLNGIEHTGGRNNGCAVLIIMKHRNRHQFAQTLLDDETFRRFNILKIDAAKGGAKIFHRIDEFFGVFGVNLQINRVNIGKALEQHRLALHHRLGGQRAKVAKA